jgi:hypothetical protein
MVGEGEVVVVLEGGVMVVETNLKPSPWAPDVECVSSEAVFGEKH